MPQSARSQALSISQMASSSSLRGTRMVTSAGKIVAIPSCLVFLRGYGDQKITISTPGIPSKIKQTLNVGLERGQRRRPGLDRERGAGTQLLLIRPVQADAAETIPVVERRGAEQAALLNADIGPQLLLRVANRQITSVLGQPEGNTQELPSRPISFALEQAPRAHVGSANQPPQDDPRLGTRQANMLACSHLDQPEQQRPDAAVAILRMNTDKGRDLRVILVPDAGKTHNLSSGCDYDPGIIGQVKVWSLPLGQKILPRATHCAILAPLAQSDQLGKFSEVFGCRRTRHKIF